MRMAVLSLWDGRAYKRDNRSGRWERKRVVVAKSRVLHVLDDQPLPAADEEGHHGQSKRKLRISFHASASFNLNLFKLEVGAVELVPDANSLALYCLFLISGHTKVSFGFDSKASLQVRLKNDTKKAFNCNIVVAEALLSERETANPEPDAAF